MNESVAQDQIVAFVDRILRMKEEKRAIQDDIREIYAEAKGNGFDKTVLGKLVNYVEKRATDAAALAEGEAVFDLYLSAYLSAKGLSHTHAPARAAIEHRNEGAAATETAPDYLREPPVVVSGQMRREGDAPLEADRQAPVVSEAFTGEHPPSNSPETADEPGAADLRASDALSSGSATREDAAAAAPDPRAFIKQLRPHCQNPDACGGQGKSHCFSCSVKIKDDPLEAA